MSSFLLELEHLTVNRSKERWNFVLTFTFDDPNNPLNVLVIPIAFNLRNDDDNQYDFDKLAEVGRAIHRFELAENQSFVCNAHLVHHRKGFEVANQIVNFITSSGGVLVLDTVLNNVPVYSIVKTSLTIVKPFLEKLSERDFGTAHLTITNNAANFASHNEVDTKVMFTSNYAEIVVSWIKQNAL